MTGQRPSAPELRARLAAAESALAEFRDQDEARASSPFTAKPDYRTSAYALAAVVHSVAVALRGALEMLDDDEVILAQREQTMVTVWGALSVSMADAPVVTAALADAAEWRRSRADVTCERCESSDAAVCDEHAADLDAAGTYDALTARLGGAR